MLSIDELKSISSVIKNFSFFVAEKWKIASDKSGSGNTANIGSITNIQDLLKERGMFSDLGEKWFDDYWINYKKIRIMDNEGKSKIISTLQEFVEFRGGDSSKIISKRKGNL